LRFHWSMNCIILKNQQSRQFYHTFY
jgi:hypothetical protein